MIVNYGTRISYVVKGGSCMRRRESLDNGMGFFMEAIPDG
jgi:hypothetical protein